MHCGFFWGGLKRRNIVIGDRFTCIQLLILLNPLFVLFFSGDTAFLVFAWLSLGRGNEGGMTCSSLLVELDRSPGLVEVGWEKKKKESEGEEEKMRTKEPR
ncbi:hypothetical protein VTL71DRAFT_14918 [Oculimacula yallundae]|uniref:Transmembrane protein n=1 Tax=Oculimacula yallundae TaxID=86028 RepID=A0ABR4CH61_9HELO